MTRSKVVSRPDGAGAKTANVAAKGVSIAPVLVGARGDALEKSGTRGRLVRDLMTEKVFTLRPSNNLATLYDLMDSKHVRHVPIVDSEGELVGLVTHVDLSRSALGSPEELPLSAERDALRRRKIRDMMATEPDTIEPDAPLTEAAEMLLENKMGCLPVVEGLHLVGIITEADFVRDHLERG
jgi:CBS domain-containing membrane protein